MSNVLLEMYNVCRGDVLFTTEREEIVSQRIKIPCAPTLNVSPLPIDICYNWWKPYLVAYHNFAPVVQISECSRIGHKAAGRLVVAGVSMILFT